MKDLAPYLYPLIFAAVVLLNYLMQRIARWRKRQSEKQEGPKSPQEVPQTLEERKQPRERLEQKGEQLQRPREEPMPAGVAKAAERIQRVRAAQEEPLEVRQARARTPRPEVAGQPIRARRAAGLRALLTNRRSLRQAVVLMTVLGPSRAQESPAGRATRHGA